jgi:hypothetical protein
VSPTPAAPRRQPLLTRLYADFGRARRAIQALKAAGVPAEAISVLSCSIGNTNEIERATGASDDLEDVAVRQHPLTEFVDWLGRVGSVTVPGFGAVLGTGDLWQDVAVGARNRGAITGALVGIGVPIEQAERFEKSVRRGDVLIVVQGRDLTTSPEQLRSLLDAT